MYVFLRVAAVFVLLCIVIICVDSGRFVVRKYQIKHDKIKGHHRYVFLSDLHNKIYGKDHARLLAAIDQAAPEAVLIGGDLLTASPGTDPAPAVSLVRQLAGKGYPIYYANGNHEYRIRIYEDVYQDMYQNYEEQIAQTGAVRLIDKSVYLEKANIVISGLEIGRKYYKRFQKCEMKKGYLLRHLGQCREDAFTILLAHNPEHMDAYAAYGADLVLSGHLHGGVARLPLLGGVISPSLRLFPKYDGGRFQKDETCMIVSRGLGAHTIPIRFCNPGELVVLDLVEGQTNGIGSKTAGV